MVIGNSKQGWGRLIDGASCQIGWWRAGELHGNSRRFQWKSIDNSVANIVGWYEGGRQVGECRKDSIEYPYWVYSEELFTKDVAKLKNNRFFSGVITKFDLADLRSQGTLPAGVIQSKREQYLHDDQFKQVFKMTKDEFNKLQPWKQDSEKKKLLLY